MAVDAETDAFRSSRSVSTPTASAEERAHAPGGLVCFLIVFALYSWLAWRSWDQQHSSGALNWYTSILWTLPVLSSSLGLVGILRAGPGESVTEPSDELPLVRDQLIVLVPTVAREDTLPALERVLSSFLRHLPRRFLKVRVDVVVEEACEGSRDVLRLSTHPCVRVITVPSDYRPPRGTRFKARANHYALELRAKEAEARDDVWVLHMDDDTAIGADTVVSLANFITEQPEASAADASHLAQGVLSYPRELSASRVLWLADAVRPGCDISLFAATTGRGSPRMGLHGELLLIRASIEDEIGWDFGPSAIVEDAQFALEFCSRYPGRASWFGGRSYGVSPATLSDFLRQRERWSWGLLTLATNRSVPWRRRTLLLGLVTIWATAPLQHPAVALALTFMLADASTSPVSPLVIPLWSLNVAFCVWLYWEGLKINVQASARTGQVWWEPVLLVLMLPVFALWEAAGVTLGMAKFLTRRDKTFTVIRKSA